MYRYAYICCEKSLGCEQWRRVADDYLNCSTYRSGGKGGGEARRDEAREKERKGMREGKDLLPAVLRASSGKKTFAMDSDDTLDKTQETDSR